MRVLFINLVRAIEIKNLKMSDAVIEFYPDREESVDREQALQVIE